MLSILTVSQLQLFSTNIFYILISHSVLYSIDDWRIVAYNLTIQYSSMTSDIQWYMKYEGLWNASVACWYSIDQCGLFICVVMTGSNIFRLWYYDSVDAFFVILLCSHWYILSHSYPWYCYSVRCCISWYSTFCLFLFIFSKCISIWWPIKSMLILFRWHCLLINQMTTLSHWYRVCDDVLCDISVSDDCLCICSMVHSTIWYLFIW